MTVSSGKQTKSETLPLTEVERTNLLDRLPSVICSAFGPLSWSDQDTRQTISEVKRHNVKWLRVCDPEKYEKLARGEDE